MRRSLIFPLLALVLAAVAALAVNSALRSKDLALRIKDARLAQVMSQTAVILIAAHDLPAGSELTPDSVKAAKWPRNLLPEGAVTKFSAVADSIVRTPFLANEPIVASKLIAADKKSGLLPLLIPPNMRAMSVQVDEVSDIAGFVLPHTKVDVLATYAATTGANAVTLTVLQDVEVLAVAQHTEKDQPQVERVVTFLVTPQEAERLALVSHVASLRLALRSYGDEQAVISKGVNLEEVFASPASNGHADAAVLAGGHRARKRATARGFRVEVLRDGNSRETLTFDAARGFVAHSTQPQTAPKASAAQTAVAASGKSDGQQRGNRGNAYAINNPE